MTEKNFDHRFRFSFVVLFVFRFWDTFFEKLGTYFRFISVFRYDFVHSLPCFFQKIGLVCTI